MISQQGAVHGGGQLTRDAASVLMACDTFVLFSKQLLGALILRPGK